MQKIRSKALREIAGAILGAILAAPIAYFLVTSEMIQELGVVLTMVFFVLLGGTLMRGEAGWIVRGAMTGAIGCHLFLGNPNNPKSNAAGFGVIAGAIGGLILMIIVVLFKKLWQCPPIKQS
jgi:hypothetical protein